MLMVADVVDPVVTSAVVQRVLDPGVMRSILYPSMVPPPRLAGAVQDRLMASMARVGCTERGEVAAESALTAVEALDHAPGTSPFIPRTRNVTG